MNLLLAPNDALVGLMLRIRGKFICALKTELRLKYADVILLENIVEILSNH